MTDKLHKNIEVDIESGNLDGGIGGLNEIMINLSAGTAILDYFLNMLDHETDIHYKNNQFLKTALTQGNWPVASYLLNKVATLLEDSLHESVGSHTAELDVSFDHLAVLLGTQVALTKINP